MIEAIRNQLAVRVLKRAGVFLEMRVVDRGGIEQVMFLVKHHGVKSWMSRNVAVGIAKSMEQFRREDEFKQIVWVD